MRLGAMCSCWFVLTFAGALPSIARAQGTSFGANVHGFAATRESYNASDLGGRFAVDGGFGAGAALGLGARDLLFTIGYEIIGGQRERVNGAPNGLTASTQDITFGLRANFGGHRHTFPWIWAELGQRTLSDTSRTLQGAMLSVRTGLELQLTPGIGVTAGARLGVAEYSRLDRRRVSSVTIATPRAWYGRLELGIEWRPPPPSED